MVDMQTAHSGSALQLPVSADGNTFRAWAETLLKKVYCPTVYCKNCARREDFLSGTKSQSIENHKLFTLGLSCLPVPLDMPQLFPHSHRHLHEHVTESHGSM